MNRSLAAVWMLVLFGTAACPHAFGRGGTVDRAVHADLLEQLRESECDPQKVRELCGAESYDLCMEECEEP